MDTNTNTTENKNLVVAPKFDAKKAIAQRAQAIAIADQIRNEIGSTSGMELIPTFGGAEIVTVLAIMQPVEQVIEKAVYDVSQHFVQFTKGGKKVFVPIVDGEGNEQKSSLTGLTKFEQVTEGGETAFKKERTLLQKAVKGSDFLQLLVSFSASDITSFSKTLGEALQATELKLFTALKAGKKVLRNNKPLIIALKVNGEMISTSFASDNSIEAKYLNPATYAGKDDAEQSKIWNEFCKMTYQSLKLVLQPQNEVLTVNATYKAMVGIK